MTGLLHSIETMGALDGPGIRTVAFLQGCPARCIYCHNPDTWKVGEGRHYNAEQIVKFAKRYKPYYGEEGGVTFSGGEPLMQGEFITACMKELKKEGVNAIIDTSGTFIDSHTEDAVAAAQLIILDVKHTSPKTFQEITGVSQDTLLKLIDIINKNKKPVWIRQVIVPGINDTEDNIAKLNRFATRLDNVERIELLGYHNMGKIKWDKMCLEYPLKHTEPMDNERLEELKGLVTW